MRSAGQSETTPFTAPYTHHEDLYRLLQALAITRATLIGLSNHSVALDFAIAYSSSVEKLVLVSPGLRGYEFRDPWIATHFAAMLQALEQRNLSAAVEVFLTMWVDGPNRTPAQVDPGVRERVRRMVTHAFPMSRHAPNSRGLEPPAAGRLSGVTAPTLVVLGEKDAPDIHAIAELIREGVAGSRLTTIRDAAHTLVLERPSEFNRVVEQLLAR